MKLPRMYIVDQFFSNNINIHSLQEKLNFDLRPNASNGIWLMFVLPIVIMVSAIKHFVVLSKTYKLLPLFSVGFILSSLLILRGLRKEQYVKFNQVWLFFPISILFYIFLDTGFLFSLYSGFFCTIFYCQVYLLLLRKFPKSFTLGEAGLTTQTLTILLYTTLPHFVYSVDEPITTIGQSSTVIIQMELFGIMCLVIFLKYFNIKGNLSIYFWMISILLLTFYLPLHVFLRRSPVLWVLSLLIEDYPTMKMLIYWVICCCIAALAIIRQRNAGDKASSSQRKIFHVLAVAVYIPGLIYECNLLYLGSGILLGLFFLLEILRNLRLPPLGNLLQDSFMVLSDEKDAGMLAVTPIYLLTGCTSPLWIHPAPCDVTDSSLFNLLPLLSGVLSVGIGDTTASLIGSKYGTHFYSGSKKTIEGTLACITSQLLVVFLLYELGYLINLDILWILRIILAVVLTSLVEAKTDQIDNAVLPFIMYIILI